MVRFIPLERVNVEDGVRPGETCALELVLNGVSLGVVRGNDLELFVLLFIKLCDMDCGFDFAVVLRGKNRILARTIDPCSGGSCVPSNYYPS